MLALGWLVLVTVAAIFAPWIAPYDPNAQNLANTNAGISASHWLGTDDLGRDVLSRLIYGARISMEITFETVIIALALALVIGLVAGFRGGRIDYLLMRGADAGLAFPPLILALAVVAVLGSGVNDVSLAFALVFAPGFARFIRGQTLAIKEEAFVEASTSIGTSPTRIVVTRILPNVLTGLAVGIAIALGAALLTSSGLSFLGLGPPPPAASWGSMLEEAYNTALFTHPWSLVPSGLIIAVTVLAFNTLGDALRDTVSGTATKGRGRQAQRGLTAVTQPTEQARAAEAPEPDSRGSPGSAWPVHRVRHRDRPRPRRGRGLFRRRSGTNRRPGGRVGLRQDGELTRRLAPPVLTTHAHRWRLHPLRRPRATRRRLRRAAKDPRG